MKTEIVAWWGAILATIVFAWDIYKWWTAGPKLRVSVQTGMKSINMPQYDDKTLIHVNVSVEEQLGAALSIGEAPEDDLHTVEDLVDLAAQRLSPSKREAISC